MIQAAQSSTTTPQILKFAAFKYQDQNPETPLTLRRFYQSRLLPEIRDFQSKGSLKEDRIALNHWDRLIGNIDIRDVNRETLQTLRVGLESSMADATINKTWRELKAIFEAANEEGIIDHVPTIGRKMKSKLIKRESKQRQREVLTADELASLWISCKNATYPNVSCTPAPKAWRVALVLFWTYGIRTRDLISLEWSDIEFKSRLIRFEAQKTGKLQGLPMTDVVEAHLRSIHRVNAKRVFPGFNSHGSYMAKHKTWKRGYYATWRNEIVANSEVETPVQLKNFRQRVVNDYNARFPSIKLGSWIAGHSMQGVSAINYELPTREIREAIEAAPVPDCFHEIG